MLKNENKNYDWSNIVRIMSTQKAVTISVINKNKEH
jgi:hypothetical protein